jgi:hypothetical protein
VEAHALQLFVIESPRYRKIPVGQPTIMHALLNCACGYLCPSFYSPPPFVLLHIGADHLDFN